MATFRRADGEAFSLVAELIAEHYPDLAGAGVTVNVLFAYAPRNEQTGEPKGPALRHANWPAAALVRVVSHRDRVAGMDDAVILVDGLAWEEWEDERRRAVLHHELEHLEVQKDEEGAVRLDDCHRPKLKIRPHDFQLGGFVKIVERYGMAALEAEAAAGLRRTLTQAEFDWGEELEPAGVV